MDVYSVYDGFVLNMVECADKSVLNKNEIIYEKKDVEQTKQDDFDVSFVGCLHQWLFDAMVQIKMKTFDL